MELPKTGERNRGTKMPVRIIHVTDMQCTSRPEGKNHILVNIERNEQITTRCRYCHRSWARLDLDARAAL